jgi:hypothetical protein
MLLIGLLVALALIGGSLMWALTLNTSPYEAEALVLFKVNANSQAVLSTDPTTFPQFRDTSLDLARQQQNTVLLMSGMDIAREVQKRAASAGDSSIAALASKDPATLFRAMHIQIRGSFVSVKAEALAAPTATWLANTWAEVGVAAVNKAYAQPSANVDEALQGAKSQLDVDQAALQDFMAQNPIISLTTQLSQTLAFIDSAANAGTQASFVLYDAEQESIRIQISTNYTITAGLNQQLNQIKALRTRIQQAPEDPASAYANQVSLLLLLNSVIGGTTGSSPEARVQLQLSLGDASSAPLSKGNQLSELDAAVQAIQGLQDDISRQTAELEGTLSGPLPAATPGQPAALSPTLQAYLDRQNQLQSQLEQKRFELSQLEKTRDLDQSAYDLLRSRLAEQNVNGMISNIVDIGSAADEEQTIDSRSALRSLVLVVGQWVLLGLALGIFLAYLLNFVWPNFNSNDTLGRGLFRRGARRARVGGSG